MKGFDFSKEYGLVLEGGGAKGAYQIGVWKALRECGVKIKGVSGVSVGALNGALICMGDYEKAEEIWENICYSKIMNVNNEMMENLMGGKFKEIDLLELTKGSTKILKERGVDVEPLKNWIGDIVDEEKIKKSPIEFVLGTFSLSKFKKLEIDAKEVEEGLLKDFLLASSYFPGFKNKKLHGEIFVDGGIVDNVPTDMLIKRGYKDIIIIRIFGIGLERKIKIEDDVNIIEIYPKKDLGNMFEFDCKRSIQNIKTGYFDGLKCLRGLVGKEYYISSPHSELYYLNKLLSLPEPMQTILQEYYRVDTGNEALYMRNLIEAVYPMMAGEQKLGENWSYQELYLSFVERAAAKLDILPYEVYTEEKLLSMIEERYRKEDGKNGVFSDFEKLVMRIILTKKEKGSSV